MSISERFAKLVDFPSSMTFKVIGLENQFENNVIEFFNQKKIDIKTSIKSSRSGKYNSMSITLIVISSVHLENIYLGLTDLTGVIHVI